MLKYNGTGTAWRSVTPHLKILEEHDGEGGWKDMNTRKRRINKGGTL
jgi:hypothetical protein